MNFFWLDASALVKRYLMEIGTPLLNHLFAQVLPQRIVCLLEGVGEVISVLIRRRNGGAISAAACQQSLTALRTEIINQPDIEKSNAFHSKLSIRGCYSINIHSIARMH